MQSLNPFTGQVLQHFTPHSESELKQRLELAQSAFAQHRLSSLTERAEKLNNLAHLLDSEKQTWARLMVLEMGKPLKAALAEVEKCAWVCRFYADKGAEFLADEAIPISGQDSYRTYQPLGAVLAIMPWNFPFWQVFRFAAPALMAGNVGLLKHASNVPQCALAIESLIARAGFPQGAFQTLLIPAARVAEAISHPVVAAVTLTGSERAGSQVAALAGQALKKTVLELGGADPFIVMPSASLEQAVEAAVTSRLLNNGQSCIAAKRFLIHERIYAEFEARLVERMKAVRMGDPLEADTELGPLATEAIRQEVHQQVTDAIDAKATCLLGGKLPDTPGFFYPPTVLSQIPENTQVFREEVFGPVAALFRIGSLSEAISLANSHRYGLASSVWTHEASEQRRFIRDLEAGATFVNAMVASDPRLPFGGIKKSGFGRELSREGIREFVNVKTVVVKET